MTSSPILPAERNQIFMLNAKRVLGLALASLALIGASSLPQPGPLAAGPIATSFDMTDFQSTAPSAELLQASNHAVMLEAELVEDAAPVVSNLVETEASGTLTLAGLVEAVADMPPVELTEDMRCLASAVYNEARGESIEGQLAVAQVVLNRTASERWPDSICEVVYQQAQFSFTFDGHPDFPEANSRWRRAEAIAIIAASGNWQDVTGDALFFHAAYVNPVWRDSFVETRTIGQHIFYR